MSKINALITTGATAFFYLREKREHLSEKALVKSNHRFGVIAIAPSINKGKMIASVFLMDPKNRLRPEYMRSAAIGRLNSADKFVVVPIEFLPSGEFDAATTLETIVDAIGISSWIHRKYGSLWKENGAQWQDGLAGAYHNMLRTEKTVA